MIWGKKRIMLIIRYKIESRQQRKTVIETNSNFGLIFCIGLQLESALSNNSTTDGGKNICHFSTFRELHFLTKFWTNILYQKRERVSNNF